MEKCARRWKFVASERNPGRARRTGKRAGKEAEEEEDGGEDEEEEALTCLLEAAIERLLWKFWLGSCVSASYSPIATSLRM